MTHAELRHQSGGQSRRGGPDPSRAHRPSDEPTRKGWGGSPIDVLSLRRHSQIGATALHQPNPRRDEKAMMASSSR
jgi:hypothetical protein